MKKKALAVLAVMMMLVVALAGCGSSKPEAKKEDGKKGDWKWERDIEMVCVFGVGSGTDTTLRAICPAVEKELGVNIHINNVAGASGLTGMEYAHQQPADGYSYVMLTPSAVIQGLDKKASFDVKNEWVPVKCIVQDSNIVFANTKLPYKDWKGLVEYAKKNPGKPTLTLQSVSGIDALSVKQLFEQAGIKVTMVASSGAEAYSLVIGGHADMTLGSPADGEQYVKAGQINPLIVINTKRSTAMKDVPCSKDFNMTADLGPWRAIMARKGTPQAAIDSLEKAFAKAMKEKAWEDWKIKVGLNDRKGDYTQKEMGKVWNDYFDMLGKLVAKK